MTLKDQEIEIAGMRGFKDGIEYQKEKSYTEQEVLHLLDALWDRLDLFYNEPDNVFNLIKWFDECKLKK